MKKYTVDILLITYFATIGALMLAGCYKDKGNYTYDELEQFYVDSAKVGSSFIIGQFDTLKLKSGLVYAGDRSKLRYSWSAYLVSANLNGNKADTLAATEDLTAPISLFPEQYYLEFTATDTVTGRRAAARYMMKVESIGSGLLVLYERNNQVDCDLIKTKLLEGLLPADEVIRNLYSVANPAMPLTGEAIGINSFRLGGVQYISLFSSTDGVAVSPVDMVVNKKFRDLFFLPPNTPKPQGYFAPLGFLINNYESSAGYEFLVNNGQLYANMVLLAAGRESVYYQLTTATGTYKASPYTMFAPGRIVAFDEQSRGFLQAGPLGTTLGAYSSSTAGTPPFNFNNIGKDLIWLGYGYGSTAMGYGFFKNTQDNGERYIYVMDFATSTAKYIMDISSFERIAEAKLFALGMRGQLMYYATGNKIYQIVFDLSAGTASQSIDAWPHIPAGEEITCIKMCPHPGRNVSENAVDKYVMVATWNNSTGMGKVYMLQANVTSGTLQAQPAAVYEQFGKIKDIAFKF